MEVALLEVLLYIPQPTTTLYCITTDVTLNFSTENYSVRERDLDRVNEAAFMPVRVTKSSRIASPIVVDVIPLTVHMAQAMGISLDHLSIPESNLFSPPFAGMACKLSTDITLVYISYGL